MPLWCFLKARNGDIETLETAVESSKSVLFNGLELKGLIKNRESLKLKVRWVFFGEGGSEENVIQPCETGLVGIL